MTDQITATEAPIDPAVLGTTEPPADDTPPASEPQPEPTARTIPLETFTREVTPLRAKVRDLELGREEDRRQLAQARELLERFQRSGSNAEPSAPTPTAQPTTRQPTQAEIEQAAFQLNFQRDAARVIEAGQRAYGAKQWQDSVAIMQSFGLDNVEFVNSVMEIAGRDKAHEVVHALTQEPEKAVALASMSPARRIAEITRISERMTAKPAAAAASVQAPKPPAKTVSQAPAPAPRVEPTAGTVVDWRSDKASDDEFSRGWNERYVKGGGMRR